jgi:hypothetical protein
MNRQRQEAAIGKLPLCEKEVFILKNGIVSMNRQTKESRLEYSSAVKDMPLLFMEMRKTARLFESGETPENIARLSVEENIFQLEKEKRRKAMAAKTVLRLAVLKAQLVSLLANGPADIAKLVAFYALIRTDLLFFEFMRDVYREKSAIGQDIITDGDFSAFFAAKCAESQKIASWTANNLRRVKNAYKSVLCEAGLAKKQGNDLRIMKPILDEATRGCWDNHDEFAEVMLMEG